MSEPQLEIRRHSVPPGFARRTAEPQPEALATAALAPAPTPVEISGMPERSSLGPREQATTATPPRTRGHREERASAAPSADAASYAGVGSVQFNVRLLTPLHERYARLVRRLADEGFKTTATEMVHALLHEGPEDPEVARELVRRWRRVRAED